MRIILTLLLFIVLTCKGQGLKISDKDLHFLVNSHGVPMIGITMFQKGYTQAESIVVPVVLMTIVSVGKEIYDMHHGGIFSIDDLIADAKGIVTGAFITLVVNGLIVHFRGIREAERARKFYNPLEI